MSRGPSLLLSVCVSDLAWKGVQDRIGIHGFASSYHKESAAPFNLYFSGAKDPVFPSYDDVTPQEVQHSNTIFSHGRSGRNHYSERFIKKTQSSCRSISFLRRDDLVRR